MTAPARVPVRNGLPWRHCGKCGAPMAWRMRERVFSRVTGKPVAAWAWRCPQWRNDEHNSTHDAYRRIVTDDELGTPVDADAVDLPGLVDGRFLTGKTPTPRMLQVAAEVAVHGNQKHAAACLGMSLQTAKNHLFDLTKLLGSQSYVHTLTLLGWLHVPGELVGRHEHAA